MGAGRNPHKTLAVHRIEAHASLLPGMPTGYARAMSDTAVLVIDMLNAYRHPDAELLTPNGADIIDPIAGLIRVARDH